MAVIFGTGCAENRATALLTPGSELTTVKTLYVVTVPNDKRGIDTLIRDRLVTMGYSDTGAVVWREAIKSSFTQSMGETFAAATRVRLATEGAASKQHRGRSRPDRPPRPLTDRVGWWRPATCVLNLGGVYVDSPRVTPRLGPEPVRMSTLTARRRRAMVISMLNAYYDLHRGAWIACAIIDGEWIEGESFQTWREADEASQFLVAAKRPSPPRSDS